MSFACNTQVDAFWSNSDQNGVTSAKSTRTRKTERTPAIASAECLFAHAIELQPDAETAERNQGHEREAGRDDKSELGDEHERPDCDCDGNRCEQLAAQAGNDRTRTKHARTNGDSTARAEP